MWPNEAALCPAAACGTGSRDNPGRLTHSFLRDHNAVLLKEQLAAQLAQDLQGVIVWRFNPLAVDKAG